MSCKGILCGRKEVMYNSTMLRTNIYLSERQKKALEKLAKKKGISVAEIVRRIIDKELDREKGGR